MQQYPGDVSFVVEIAGVICRGERNLSSQLGMEAVPEDTGHRDDFRSCPGWGRGLMVQQKSCLGEKGEVCNRGRNIRVTK